LDHTKISYDKEKTPTCIICECGIKIKLSSDAKQMGNDIEAHAKEHAKTKSDKASANAEASRIEDLLTEQVFKAIKSNKQP